MTKLLISTTPITSSSSNENKHRIETENPFASLTIDDERDIQEFYSQDTNTTTTNRNTKIPKPQIKKRPHVTVVQNDKN
ncbi:hypothetical protein CHS0354_038038, partial [Potamilus streckersoni]